MNEGYDHTVGCKNYATIAPKDTARFEDTLYSTHMQWLFAKISPSYSYKPTGLGGS